MDGEGNALPVTEGMTPTRIAENQSRFREANEQIEAAADRMQLIGVIPFVCECPREGCTEIVRLTIAEYEAIRVSPRLFFCAPGHHEIAVRAGAAVVVGGGDGRYLTVEKVGVAGEVAEERYDKLSE
ncbi:MAG: hypothetical protein ACJ76I_04165 [Gaiellaceae bacterium]